MLNNKSEWFLHFPYRDKNIIAHTLVKTALCIAEERVWIEEDRDFIVNSLAKDKSCIFASLITPAINQLVDYTYGTVVSS